MTTTRNTLTTEGLAHDAYGVPIAGGERVVRVRDDGTYDQGRPGYVEYAYNDLTTDRAKGRPTRMVVVQWDGGSVGHFLPGDLAVILTSEGRAGQEETAADVAYDWNMERLYVGNEVTHQAPATVHEVLAVGTVRGLWHQVASDLDTAQDVRWLAMVQWDDQTYTFVPTAALQLAPSELPRTADGLVAV